MRARQARKARNEERDGAHWICLFQSPGVGYLEGFVECRVERQEENTMSKIQVSEEQILRGLDQLSPAARRAALNKLISGLERLDRLVDQNRDRIEAICQTRGLNFSRLTEEEREALVDTILHEHS
jgi:DNA anti-recombination protein RmuC